MEQGHGTARGALRDRRDADRRLRRGGCGSRARRGAGWPRPGSRSRSTLPGTSSAAAARRRSGPARTSTRFRTAGRFDGALGCRRRDRGRRADRRAARRRRLSRRGARVRRQPGLRRARPAPEAFLELHVEQGPVLERAGAPLGIVTAIFGQARGEVVFEGRADHAGTTPMDARDDALVAAAEFVLRVGAAPTGHAPATVGRLEVEPGAVNVVPARVTVSVDARAASRAGARRARRRDRLRAVLASRAGRDARPAAGSAAGGRPRARPSSSRAPATTRRSSRPPVCRPGCSSCGACNGGVSHSPDELSSEDDIALGDRCARARLARIAG